MAWKDLSSASKGAIVGFLFGLFLNLFALGITITVSPEGWAFFTVNAIVYPIAIPFIILSNIFFWGVSEFITIPIIGVISYSILGVLVGLIIGKIKSGKKKK